MRLWHNRARAASSCLDSDGREGDDLVVVGAHGGAGTSTLATLLRPAWDMGAINGPPYEPGRPPILAKGRPVLLVTRNTVAAAKFATQAVTTLCDSRVELAALVIVADGAGPEPRDAAVRFLLLERRVGGVVRMPFVPTLRLVDDPTVVRLPTRARNALVSVLDLMQGRGASPGTSPGWRRACRRA